MAVEDLLNERDIKFTPKGADFLVRCLNPEHEDRHPSMRIDQVTGIFNCFSCGFKGNLFTLFGEKPNKLQQQREKLKKLIQRKRAESVGVGFPSFITPYEGDWRGIKSETYKKFEAFLDHGTKEHEGRVMFPIRNISGRIVAFNGRHMSGGTPKYIFSPRGVRLPLFPNVEPIKGSIILVEGIFDMLNLHDKGLTNAVCCFGTNNINSDKLAMLRMKGVDTIVIFFDGDEPGQEAAEKVQLLCEKLDLKPVNVYLKDRDPGAIGQEQVSKLYEKLYG